jgi:hypothetical protein
MLTISTRLLILKDFDANASLIFLEMDMQSWR